MMKINMLSYKKFMLFFLVVVSLLSACKKKPSEPAVTSPVLTTSPVTGIGPDKAICGGNISSDGGSVIRTSGICWSKKNPVPTIADEIANKNVSSGSFSTEISSLEANSIYYVRAYASNSVGTSYGEVVSFTTGKVNIAPIAAALSIAGERKIDATLRAAYTYSDPENDPEGEAFCQWYTANSAEGAGELPISGAYSKTYVLKPEDEGKYIRVSVSVKATAGALFGAEVKSAYTEAITWPTTLSFTYNGAPVTYGIIKSAKTGKRWLDRNLGAANAPSSVDDYANFGDLFQWGRLADGHQLIKRTGVGYTEAIAVNGTTSLTNPFGYSATDDPGISQFIALPRDLLSPYDWRKPQNNALWQPGERKNNPCPPGWHVATAADFYAEDFSSLADGFAKFKITRTGSRTLLGMFDFFSSTVGFYWTSTPTNSTLGELTDANFAEFRDGDFGVRGGSRAVGFAVRCVRD